MVEGDGSEELGSFVESGPSRLNRPEKDGGDGTASSRAPSSSSVLLDGWDSSRIFGPRRAVCEVKGVLWCVHVGKGLQKAVEAAEVQHGMNAAGAGDERGPIGMIVLILPHTEGKAAQSMPQYSNRYKSEQ